MASRSPGPCLPFFHDPARITGHNLKLLSAGRFDKIELRGFLLPEVLILIKNWQNQFTCRAEVCSPSFELKSPYYNSFGPKTPFGNAALWRGFSQAGMLTIITV